MGCAKNSNAAQPLRLPKQGLGRRKVPIAVFNGHEQLAVEAQHAGQLCARISGGDPHLSQLLANLTDLPGFCTRLLVQAEATMFPQAIQTVNRDCLRQRTPIAM